MTTLVHKNYLVMGSVKSGNAPRPTAGLAVGRVARPIWRQEPVATDRVRSVPFGRDEIA